MQNQTKMHSDKQPQGDTRIEECRAIANLYRFVGRCLESELDADMLSAIRGDMRESLQGIGFEFDESFLSTDESTLLEQLAEEYTALFVAPGCISPYASVALTGTMFKGPSDKAAEAYRKHGKEFQPVMSGEFPDHVGTMICFLGELAAAQADALEQGDSERAEQLSADSDSFLLDQLGDWSIGWASRASEAAQIGFYRDLLQMTAQLLWGELYRVADPRKMQELAEKNRQEPPRMDYDADFRKASGL